MSQQELIDKLNAARAERIDAALDRLFASYANEDGLLTEDEVSARAWSRIAAADTDEDGVSEQELRDFIEARRAGEDTDEGQEDDDVEPAQAAAETSVAPSLISLRRGRLATPRAALRGS